MSLETDVIQTECVQINGDLQNYATSMEVAGHPLRQIRSIKTDSITITVNCLHDKLHDDFPSNWSDKPDEAGNQPIRRGLISPCDTCHHAGLAVWVVIRCLSSLLRCFISQCASLATLCVILRP